jgi:hypothetical protein
MTVKDLLSRLDSRELTEWVAYFNLAEKPADSQLANNERIKAFFMNKGKK